MRPASPIAAWAMMGLIAISSNFLVGYGEHRRGLPLLAPASEVGKPLGVERVVGQKLKPLTFHFAANPAKDASDLELEIDPRIATRKVAHTTNCAIVPTAMRASTTAAARFFERRRSLMIRAFGSPNIPRTVRSGRKPANAYASHNRRFRLA